MRAGKTILHQEEPGLDSALAEKERSEHYTTALNPLPPWGLCCPGLRPREARQSPGLGQQSLPSDPGASEPRTTGLANSDGKTSIQKRNSFPLKKYSMVI